ncbi:hypothetical protein [Pseudobacteriovorax antillogorgiicola]|uniref:Lipoprotein n=1 Tax=Pseudobacteriovorax antillogorgiicola TaxID=1513793 RepID=A0A1Y6C5H3_9BACT|nr:hypothetical protein [Pseudobacteriovorax antillogorgiicola]TCS49908.1 hypothetical protein EDD56_114153 [Pseudobacteriovorax antillogorgiicola]SMF44859.1 hypothetical protein SAMN06296036_113158 [Pseudobacteriovorax antillogorgiicola]
MKVIMLCVAFTISACNHNNVKYHKARLLDPMMDPEKTDTLMLSLIGESGVWLEKSVEQGAGLVGGSCPTCGG